MTLSTGTRLGPFEILAPLGAGGMGEVYRARDTRLGREVAVKVLSDEFSSDADRRERFEQEARSASALNHPNIVTIYEIGSSGPTIYIAMELVDGKTLREIAPRRAAAADQEAPRSRLPDGGRARQGARGRHRPPGPEARERDGVEATAPSRSSTSASPSS